MNAFAEVSIRLRKQPQKWLITGAAGFIGSNLLKRLLELDQTVIGLDNLSSGYVSNIEEVLNSVKKEQAARFRFVRGDIRDLATCRDCCRSVDVVLHQAALGSVPRSIAEPINTHEVNVDGFLNMLVAARDSKVPRFVYASSSSVYGNNTDLPQVESRIGAPLSPYAASKYINELYALVFGQVYNMQCIGLRYFNVFGPRQDPDGMYAAVIPRWFAGLLRDETICIYGDGKTSRDFCYIENAVQANILAACADNQEAFGQVYNIACNHSTSLNELFGMIRGLVAETKPAVSCIEPTYQDFRPGDIRHSLADISKAAKLLGYSPTHSVAEGLREAAQWYMDRFNARKIIP